MKSSNDPLSPRNCVCASLRRVTRSVTQLFDDALRPSGLRATQFNILSTIQAMGEATVTELTRMLLIDQTTLTRGLALLERDGLLKAVPKPDGRLKAVHLTRKGEQALAKALPLWAAAQEQVVSRIGSNDWDALHKKLEHLARNI